MAQKNFIVGDIDGNVKKIIDVMELDGGTNDLIVFSELSVCGYPPLDLLNDDEFINRQLAGVGDIVDASAKNPNTGVVVGYAYKDDGRMFNRIALIENGKILFVYDKKLLPTYNIFDEERYFERGTGSNLFRYKNTNIAFFICEDIWPQEADIEISPPVSKTPAIVDLAISVNASPSNIDKLRERISISEGIVWRLNCPHIYVNQYGANDALVFDGNSFCMDANGHLIAQTRKFQEDLVSVSTTVDKLQTPVYPELSDMEVLYNHAVIGIRDYVNKCGFKGVVIGSSGGIDSAMVMALATNALGPENVKAITMPTKFSSEGSVNDSVTLCNNLGIELTEHAIGEAFETISGQFNASFKSDTFDVTEENMQSRLRGLILMAYSNKFGNLVLSTGNKSEMSVGYATLYGDMNGGINPLGDMYKTEVFELARYYNDLHKKEIIPVSIIDKEPSAELAPDQKDTNSLLPYPILDPVLKIYLEGDLLEKEQLDKLKGLVMDLQAVGELTNEDIVKMIRLVINSEFKRKQAPPIIRCQRRAFGFGRNLPVAKKYDADIIKKYRA